MFSRGGARSADPDVFPTVVEFFSGAGDWSSESDSSEELVQSDDVVSVVVVVVVEVNVEVKLDFFVREVMSEWWISFL